MYLQPLLDEVEWCLGFVARAVALWRGGVAQCPQEAVHHHRLPRQLDVRAHLARARRQRHHLKSRRPRAKGTQRQA